MNILNLKTPIVIRISLPQWSYDMNWKRNLVSIISALFLFLPLSGQLRGQEIKSLTLDEVIEIALRENIDIKQSTNQVEIQKLSVIQSRMDFYPSLSASVSSSKELLNESPGDQAGTSIRASLGSSLNLFNGFRNQAQYEKAKLEYLAQEKNLDYRKQSIILSAIEGYIEVLLKDELIRIEEENLVTQQLLLDRIEAMCGVGSLPVSDLLQQKADISQAELNLITARRDFQVYKMQLLNILCRQPENDLRFISPLLESIIEQLLETEVDTTMDSIFAHRPDMISQEFNKSAAAKEVAVANSGNLPSVSLSLSAASSYQTSSSVNFNDQVIEDNPSIGIGLSISIPVFDKYQTKTSVQKAKINLTNQKLDLEKLKLSIRLEIEKAVLDYRTAIKQRETAKAQLEYSTLAYEASQARYDVGAATYAELSQVRSQYISSANNSTEAGWNLLQKFAALCFYRGSIDLAVKLFD